MEYLDFDVKVGLGSGREYPIAVNTPAGEAESVFQFPFDTLALENRLKDLQIALISSGNTRRKTLSPREETVQRLGKELFDMLIAGEIRNRYDVSCEQARLHNKGLRIKLLIQDATLATLPWEFLYDSRSGDYVCLSTDTSIVRYLQLERSVLPLTVTPPLRILGMIVTPSDLAPLDVQSEKQRIERSISALQKAGRVELTWLDGQTWKDLRGAMLKGQWHIFHFIGHGNFDKDWDEGIIALADSEGRSREYTATEFSRMLADHRSLRLVLLNACEGARGGTKDVFSSTAAMLVRSGIPAVVAMQYAITDRAAIEFSQTFYEYLVSGLPVDIAVAEGRKAILFELRNTLEWGAPMLYLRSQSGNIFSVAQDIATSEVESNNQQYLENSLDGQKIQQKEVSQIEVPAKHLLASLFRLPLTKADTFFTKAKGNARQTFCLQWILANVLGMSASLILIFTPSIFDQILPKDFSGVILMMYMGMVGMIIGTAQLVVIRRHLPSIHVWDWQSANIISGIVAFIASHFLAFWIYLNINSLRMSDVVLAGHPHWFGPVYWLIEGCLLWFLIRLAVIRLKDYNWRLKSIGVGLLCGVLAAAALDPFDYLQWLLVNLYYIGLVWIAMSVLLFVLGRSIGRQFALHWQAFSFRKPKSAKKLRESIGSTPIGSVIRSMTEWGQWDVRMRNGIFGSWIGFMLMSVVIRLRIDLLSLFVAITGNTFYGEHFSFYNLTFLVILGTLNGIVFSTITAHSLWVQIQASSAHET